VALPGLTHEGAVRNATEFLQKIRLKGLDTKQLMPISRYWAGVTLESIAGLFPRATAIQSWFLTCANLILRSEGVDDEGHVVYESDMTMSWTTPLGFPVVQDIRKFESKSVRRPASSLALWAGCLMSPGLDDRPLTSAW
jgi:DNA-directed RNA polymerase